MAYDIDDLLLLKHGQMIAKRTYDEAVSKSKEDIENLTAADIKYGDTTIEGKIENLDASEIKYGDTTVEYALDNSEAGRPVATDEEVEEMLDDVFGDGTYHYKVDVSSAEELAEAMGDSDVSEVVLDADIVTNSTSSMWIDGGSKDINLNGHSVTMEYEDMEASVGLVYAYNGAIVNIYDESGEGTLDAGNACKNNIVLWATEDSVINIYGGNFTCGTVSEDSGAGSTTVYAQKGNISIYGGYFENRDWDGNVRNCVLNITNNSGSHIWCYGGSYLDQNPADGDDRDTTTGATFVADGHTVVESEVDEHPLYTVVEE